MAARFVNLQRKLRGADDQIESTAGSFRGGQKRERLVANLQSRARQIELFDEFPSASLKIAAERVRERAPLKFVTIDRQRLDAAAHLGGGLFDVASDGRCEDFFLAIRGNIAGDLMNSRIAAHRFGGGEKMLDFLFDRD